MMRRPFRRREIRSRRPAVQKAYRMAGRRSIEDDVIVGGIKPGVSEQVGELIECGNFGRASAG